MTPEIEINHYNELYKKCKHYKKGFCKLLRYFSDYTCVVERGATDRCPAYTEEQLEEFFKKEEFDI